MTDPMFIQLLVVFKDQALKDQEKEKEKEILLLEAKWNETRMRKDYEVDEAKRNQKLKESFYKKQLSAVTLRCILEMFFDEVYEILRENQDILKHVPSDYLRKDKKGDSSAVLIKEKLKKTELNRILRFKNVKDHVWEKINITNDVVLPDFPEELIYGSLSEMIHYPDAGIV
jgi:hypothetical protein